MIELEIHDTPEKNWNQKLLETQLGTIFQTKEYAYYFESRLKSKPKFLRFFTKTGDLVGQLILFQSYKGQKRLARTIGRGLIFSYFSKFQRILPKFNYWNFGPVIFDCDFMSEISESLGSLLKSWNSPFRGILHPLDSNFIFPQKFNFQNEKCSTFIIDLKQDKEAIFKNTNKNSVQKNIKRSIQRGVKVTQFKSKKDLMIYYELQKKHREENKIQPYEKDDIFERFHNLSPLGNTGFIAWFDEIPISAISFSSFNGYINESGIARSKIDTAKKLYSQDLLRWKIIEWGKQHNCNFYDMSGINPENRNSKEEGIFRNKKKWGGKQYFYLSFTR